MAGRRRGRDARRSTFRETDTTPSAETLDAAGADDGAADGLATDLATDLATEVVDEITWYMREHKVSRADLASALGVSPGRVSQILSGCERLSPRTLGSVLTALGARIDVTLTPATEPAPV